MKTLFLGDLSPTEVTNPLFEAGDMTRLFSDSISLFPGNDACMVNLECALTDRTSPIDKIGPALKATPKVGAVLAELGIRYCGLSNNHFFDYGEPGAADTLRVLDEAGIQYTGFGSSYADSRRNLLIHSGGETLCVIAVCEHEYSYAIADRMGCRPFDPYDTISDIRAARQSADRVVVMYHGGKEYCPYPSPRLRKLCHAMAENGADMVLCQHSHCIGCYEKVHDCHILYGQGNFHFVKPRFSVPEMWNQSLAVRYDTTTHAVSFIPLVNTETGIALAAGTEKETIQTGFETRCRALASDVWERGWHDFCEENRQRYIGAMQQAFAETDGGVPGKMFGHYIDCEAHFDVLKELCPTAHAAKKTY